MSSLTEEQLDELRALFDLARTGDPLLLQYLDAGVPPNLTNGQGDSLLVLATYHRQAQTVRALLERGADTERVNDRGQTALGCAVFRRDVPLVEMLLAAGANPDGGLRTPREIATFFGFEEMLTLLPAAEPPAEQ